MMRWVRWLAPLLTLGLAGCGSPTTPDSSWVQVEEHTACEALVPRFCVGLFGFTVQSDGTFTVGPADDGTTLTGSLTDSERAQLSSEAAQVSATLTTNPACDPAHTIAGIGDRVDFVDSRAGTVPVYQLGPGTICYRAGREQAIALHTDLVSLMGKYYPRPFPPT
jgi:hypothetical protein